MISKTIFMKYEIVNNFMKTLAKHKIDAIMKLDTAYLKCLGMHVRGGKA